MKSLITLLSFITSSVAFAGGPSYVSSTPVVAQSVSSPSVAASSTAGAVSAKKKLAPIDPTYARYVQLDGALYVYDERSPKATLRLNADVDYDGALKSTTQQVQAMMAEQQRVERVGSFPEPLLKLPSMPGKFGASSLPQFPSKMNQQIRGNQPSTEKIDFVSPFAK